MEAKLDVKGLLSVKRRGTFRRQYCPYTSEDRCGDFCPRLTEEDPMKTFDTPSIFVCGQSYILTVDEREEK